MPPNEIGLDLSGQILQKVEDIYLAVIRLLERLPGILMMLTREKLLNIRNAVIRFIQNNGWVKWVGIGMIAVAVAVPVSMFAFGFGAGGVAAGSAAAAW